MGRAVAGSAGSGEAACGAMRAVNPAFIPRNHLVEAALTAAVERSDFQPFEDLLAVLSRPFERPARTGALRHATAGRREGVADLLWNVRSAGRSGWCYPLLPPAAEPDPFA